MEKGPFDIPQASAATPEGIPGAGEDALSGIPGLSEGSPSGIPGLSDDQPSGFPGLNVTSSKAAPAGADAPGRTRREWIELIAAAALTLFFAFLLLGFVINAAAPTRGGGGRALNVVLAAVAVGLVVLCGEWTLRIEHRFRRRRGSVVAARFDTARAVPRHKEPLRSRRGRHYGPVGATVYLVIMLAITLAGFGNALSTKSDASRSKYVQAHGVAASGTVTNVDNIAHCGRSSCYHTAEITVRLDTAILGATTTVVHFPGRSDLSSGDRINILVDPKEPGYAEIPGAPFATSGQWIALIVITVLFGALTIFMAFKLRHLLVRRRQHLADAGAAIAPAG
jgi:hypothetical protein